MLVLFETSLGFCLFKLFDNGKLDQLHKHFETPEGATNLMKLQSIHRFSSTADAVEDMSAVGEGKLSKNLKKFLIDEISGGIEGKKSKETLAVTDPKLGGAISKKLGIKVVSDSTTIDLFRGIRTQLAPLLGEYNVEEKDLNTMSLGLSHSLSRFKLKFSPDKVDTMIVQAIALLDDLDKEINTYAMRVKEWYGWHFPEMGKIITDNLAYAKIVKAMGFRTNYNSTDFSTILPEELEETLKAVAAVSMGTEISDTDLMHIQSLASQVIDMMGYRTELYEYLRNRMVAIAPNLTAILGELVGARLIAHSGSLMNLAKAPASTIQILGAEKALFRALKTKHDTPKYGLIFHSSLVGSAPGKLKGKMARMAAAKAALSIRHDALADADAKSAEDSATLGIEARAKLESRLRKLEHAMGIQGVRSKDRGDRGNQKPFMKMTNTGGYNNAADDVLIPAAGTSTTMDIDTLTAANGKERKKKEKKEKKEKRKLIMELDDAGEGEVNMGPTERAEKQTEELQEAAAANGEETEETLRLRKEAKKAAKAAKKAAKAGSATNGADLLPPSATSATNPPASSASELPPSSKKRKSEADVDGEGQEVASKQKKQKKKERKVKEA